MTSNNLQPLKLIRKYNVAARSIAVIFVNTNLNGMHYEGVEVRAQQQREIFELLKYD